MPFMLLLEDVQTPTEWLDDVLLVIALPPNPSSNQRFHTIPQGPPDFAALSVHRMQRPVDGRDEHEWEQVMLHLWRLGGRGCDMPLGGRLASRQGDDRGMRIRSGRRSSRREEEEGEEEHHEVSGEEEGEIHWGMIRLGTVQTMSGRKKGGRWEEEREVGEGSRAASIAPPKSGAASSQRWEWGEESDEEGHWTAGDKRWVRLGRFVECTCEDRMQKVME